MDNNINPTIDIARQVLSSPSDVDKRKYFVDGLNEANNIIKEPEDAFNFMQQKYPQAFQASSLTHDEAAAEFEKKYNKPLPDAWATALKANEFLSGGKFPISFSKNAAGYSAYIDTPFGVKKRISDHNIGDKRISLEGYGYSHAEDPSEIAMHIARQHHASEYAYRRIKDHEKAYYDYNKQLKLQNNRHIVEQEENNRREKMSFIENTFPNGATKTMIDKAWKQYKKGQSNV